MPIVGIEQVVLDFSSSILWRRNEDPLSFRVASGKNLEHLRSGTSRDSLARELWKLSTSVNYGGEVNRSSSRRGHNLISQ